MCVCVCSPVPTAAHLHAGDPRGPIFAIDARETLQKGELSLSLMPLRGTKRLMVEAKKGWEGKGKLQPCTDPGAGHRMARTGQRDLCARGSAPAEGTGASSCTYVLPLGANVSLGTPDATATLEQDSTRIISAALLVQGMELGEGGDALGQSRSP